MSGNTAQYQDAPGLYSSTALNLAVRNNLTSPVDGEVIGYAKHKTESTLFTPLVNGVPSVSRERTPSVKTEDRIPLRPFKNKTNNQKYGQHAIHSRSRKSKQNEQCVHSKPQRQAVYGTSEERCARKASNTSENWISDGTFPVVPPHHGHQACPHTVIIQEPCLMAANPAYHNNQCRHVDEYVLSTPLDNNEEGQTDNDQTPNMEEQRHYDQLCYQYIETPIAVQNGETGKTRNSRTGLVVVRHGIQEVASPPYNWDNNNDLPPQTYPT
eukprot:UN30017